MTVEMVIEGPFKIEFEWVRKSKSKMFTAESLANYWANDCPKSFQKKQGCYIFAMQYGRGFTPWYVGKASKGFDQEIFAHHKLTYYSRVLLRCSGNPVMFFVTPPAGKNKVPSQDLDHMEKELGRV